jgi:pilus assembly protein CpaC
MSGCYHYSADGVRALFHIVLSFLSETSHFIRELRHRVDQFLETGVILRVTPSVDSDGRIALRVRPEVSSGSLLGGIPSKKTTEVNTQLVAENGQSILIGGLIKATSGQRRIGVPILGDVPGLGKLFSNNEHTGTSTETIVLITPRIVPTRPASADVQVIEQVEQAEGELRRDFAAPAALH